jgi:DNA-binding LytR/AlgR family response regulator
MEDQLLNREHHKRPESGLDDSIFYKDGSSFQRLRFKEIVYLEADGAYTKIHTRANIIVERKIILDYQKKLPDNLFLRVHKSFVINLDYLDAILPQKLIVNGNSVPLGRSYKDELLTMI